MTHFLVTIMETDATGHIVEVSFYSIPYASNPSPKMNPELFPIIPVDPARIGTIQLEGDKAFSAYVNSELVDVIGHLYFFSETPFQSLMNEKE